jgi:MFS family permease
MKAMAGRKLLIVIILICFFQVLSSAVTQALRPIYFVEVGASAVQLGLIMAVPSIVTLLTRVPASTLVNRLGRWKMMFASILITAVATALFAYVNNPVYFYPLTGVSALAWAMFSPVTVEYVSSQSSRATRGTTMGLYFTSIAAALFVGPLLASVLTLFLNLRQLFLFSTIFPVISLVIILAVKKYTDAEDSSVGNAGEGLSGSLTRILGNRVFLGTCAARVGFSFSMGVFTTIYAVYAGENLGFTASAISLLFTFRGVSNMLVRMPAGRLSDRVGRKKPFVIAYFIAMAAFVLFAYFKEYVLIIPVMILFGLGWGIRIAPAMALVSESVDDVDRPLSLSVFMTMFDLGSTIGSLFAGFAGALLSRELMLLACTPVMGFTLTVFLLLSAKPRTSEHIIVE